MEVSKVIHRFTELNFTSPQLSVKKVQSACWHLCCFGSKEKIVVSNTVFLISWTYFVPRGIRSMGFVAISSELL
jgi:hypothetical protein